MVHNPYKYLILDQPLERRLLPATPSLINAEALSVPITTSTSSVHTVTAKASPIVTRAQVVAVTPTTPGLHILVASPSPIVTRAASVLVTPLAPGLKILTSSPSEIEAAVGVISITPATPTTHIVTATPSPIKSSAIPISITAQGGAVGLCLDGVSQYLTRDGGGFSPSLNWAVTGWVLFTSLPNPVRTIVALVESVTGPNAFDWWVDVDSSTNTWSFNVVDGGGTLRTAKHTGFTIEVDRWYYVHAFKNSSQLTLHIGTENDLPTLGATAPLITSVQKTVGLPLTFGAILINGPVQFLEGTIDIWQVWDLTPPTPVDNWNMGLGRSYDEIPDTNLLFAAWNFDEQGSPATHPEDHTGLFPLTAVGTPLPSGCPGKSGGGLLDEHIIPSLPSVIEAVATSIVVTPDLANLHVIPSTPSLIDSTTQSIAVTPTTPGVNILASTPSSITAASLAIDITPQTPPVTSHTIAATPSLLQSNTKPIPITPLVPGTNTITCQPSLIQATAPSIPVTPTLPTLRVLSASPSEIESATTSVAITPLFPALRTIAASPSLIIAAPSSIAVTPTQPTINILAALPSIVDATTPPVVITPQTPPVTSHTLTSGPSLINATVTSIPITAVLAEFPSVTLDAGYLWRDVTGLGYIPTTTQGFYSINIKGNQLTPIALDQPGWLFSGTEGGGRRMQLGVITPGVSGEVELIFEGDDASLGGGAATIRGIVEIPIPLNDANFHNLIFGFDPTRLAEAGAGWVVFVDGIDFTANILITPDPQVAQTYWFNQVQSGSASPGTFTHIALGANLENGAPPSIALDFYNGVMDEGMMFTGTPPSLADAQYLFNNGDGVLLPQLEADNPTLFAKLHQGWELTNEGSKDFEDEFNGPILDFFNLENVVGSAEGITGLISTATAADFDDTVPDSLRVNDTTALDHSGTITLVVWVQFDEADTPDWEGIITKLLGATTEFALFRDDNESPSFRINDGISNKTLNHSMQANSATRFYFIAARHSPATGMDIVVGDSLGTTLDFSSTLPAGPMVNTSVPLVFGNWGDTTLVLDGGIDDATLSFQRLTNADLSYLYNSGAGRNIGTVQSFNAPLYAKLKSHWKMNEPSGQTRVDDISTNDAIINQGNPGNRPGHIQD